MRYQGRTQRSRLPFVIAAVILLIAAGAVVYVLYRLNVIPHRMYDGARFGIEPYMSAVDADGDGIDDQMDILQSVRAYLATEPKYKSAYYGGGYPDDGYGVCADVVAFGLLGAGYDLKELVAEDMRKDLDAYGEDRVDSNIDFRRVRNLLVYFRHTAIELTTDLSQIDQWQGGDIVVFKGHIGVVSDMRNFRGVPFVLHHGSPNQIGYEQDILGSRGDIVAHFRIS